ncbi:MAG: 2-dehydropantoate 2-reductase N-terminal domain-containing protein, partial [Armatimonadota bacterium]
MDICVVGCGYVGLVTGSCLAHLGHRVIAIDKDEVRIRALRGGRVPIYEPGLQELVTEEMTAGRLVFDTCLENGVNSSLVIFICVGTPPTETGDADMSQV